MRTYDMSPVYRNSVGFDRLFNELFDGLSKAETSGYPPYNIEVIDENDYRITVAVAGFAEEELDIEVTDRALRVTGSRKGEEAERTFLHQGIAGRSFERRFQLAQHLKVRGATLENGLLNIELQRDIPEAMKPRKISIGTSEDAETGPRVIASNDAA
ncbi:Hsp20 family protein [Parvularcula sp. ZS-1/3]|uniref:Hsp20 family protein n=1 Tax=Parvularcula mediterranea TaxID=2732508 RepID=A0A7Y3RKW0_9PROT|nr:Hsp20 family protein [Parvularcula mediterranea]NNU15495.1 Hsp20 family protein [Parvularcula mediterranea]